MSTGADAVQRAIAAPDPGPRPPLGDPGILREVQELRRDRDSIAEQLVDGFERRSGPASLGEVEKRAVRDAVAHTVAGIASALPVGDDALVVDHVAWTESVLSARGVPLELLPFAFDLLGAAFPPGLPQAERLVGVARDACTGAP